MRMVFRLQHLAAALIFAVLTVVFVSPPPASAGLDKKIEMFYYFQYRSQYRSVGTGPDRDKPTIDNYFRRNRLGFYGDVNDVLGFYLQTQMRENNRRIGEFGTKPGDDSITTDSETINLIDAYATLYWADAFQMIAGRFKNAFSRSNLEGCAQPITLDRSNYIYEPYSVSRDVGWALWGNLGDKLGYKIAAKGGRDGDDVFMGLAQKEPASNLRYQGRLQYSFLEPEFSYSYAGGNMGFRRIFTVGLGYSTEADVVYATHAGGDGSSLDTTPGNTKSYTAMTVDMFYEYPFSLATITFSAAYFDFSWDGAAYKGLHPDGTASGFFGERRGFYVKGAYMPTVKVGPGLIQLAGRLENWRFAKLGNTFDQAMTFSEVDVNYYLAGNVVKLTLAYGWNVFDKYDASGINYQDYETATFSFQMVY